MRLIVRYCQTWGNFSTHTIEISPEADVGELIQKISERFDIPKKKQSLKFKRDGFTVGSNF
jgi:hypothetical protein